MNTVLNAVNRGLLLYGNVLPYHRGKWRIVETMVDRFRLDRLYRGKSFVVRRRGITWKLRPDDLVQRSIYYCSYHEFKETRELMRLVKPDWTFFDVGAFFGYYSLLVSHLTEGRATVHAFEPFRPNYALLLHHKQVNGFNNLHAHGVAISDQRGEVEFQTPLPAACQGVGWMLADEEQPITPNSTETVRAISLDEFVAEHQVAKVDFIKIDTEGAEVSVLRGAAHTIRKFRPALMVELNPEGLARYGHDADVLSQLIRELGYTSHRATTSGMKPFEDFRSVETYCNFFCFPVQRG